jgi:CheY-like chemotaxis protein
MTAKILIVDDDPFIIAILRDFLTGKHHRVLEAIDGAQAFVLAEKEVPHLIILDLVMPGLYGSTTAKMLQDYWRTMKIPIIVLSAYTDELVRPLLKENPNVRFLRKPVDLPALNKLIEELLPAGGYTP